MRTLSRLRSPGLVWLIAGFILILAQQTAAAQTPDEAQLDLGRRLYAENCAVCHGENGQGRVGATLAKDWPAIRPDLRVRATVENGITGTPMTPWGQANGGPLSAEEIDALVAFILSWQTGGPVSYAPLPTAIPRPVLTPLPEVEGDPNAGAVLYDQNCLVCHGPNGEGRIGASLAKNYPSIRPDISIKNIIANGIGSSPMPAWSQVNGGPLADEEVDNLVAFVLTLPLAAEAQTPAPLASATPLSWLAGWGGAILAIGLLIVIIVFAIWAQARR